MTALELKKRLISKINLTDDSEILEEMLRLIDEEEVDDNIYILSVDQTQAIEEAQKQYKEGKFLSGEQADKEVNEWLDK